MSVPKEDGALPEVSESPLIIDVDFIEEINDNATRPLDSTDEISFKPLLWSLNFL